MTEIRLPFGIDLGTTRSAAAILAPDQAAPVVAADGDDLTLPSVVRSAGDRGWTVGADALASSEDGPLIQSVKRQMGQNQPLEEASELLPEDASAIILTALRAKMEAYLGTAYPTLDCHLNQVVITVPAYFDAPQIEATRRAGEAIGLEVAGLLQEPTAAAIYHTWKQELTDGTYLVYDLGGGTFDVSIISVLYGEYQVLAIDGDNYLGGDDFDRRLAAFLWEHLIDGGADLSATLETAADKERFQKLLDLARPAKENLSDQTAVQIKSADLFLDRSDQPVSLDLKISRATFTELIEDLIDGTILACENALMTARRRHDLTPEDVDGIFMVGGSTRVPAVVERLQATIGEQCGIADDALWNDEPETSVARGAALHAAAVCALQFSWDDTDLRLKITDLPATAGTDRLIGTIEGTDDEKPTALQLGDDSQSPVTLQSSGKELRFSWPNFDANALSPADLPLVDFALWRDDEKVFEDQLWLPHRPTDARQVPTLALTNPAVLAKDINLEIRSDDQATYETLIARGSHLPTSARHRLVTGDRSGSVVLRLFQHRLPIHTLVLDIPETTPPGTPFELTIDVDQAMNLTASGAIEDQEFFVRIDRPATPRRWKWDEIEEMLDRIEPILARLWGAEARRFEAQSRHLRSGIRAAVRHDPQRLQVLARRLKTLISEVAPRPTRTPGRKRIDFMIDTIRRIVFAADDDRLGRSNEDWRRLLQQLRAQVDNAWQADDDRPWQEIADRVQATFESVGQDEFFYRRRDPAVYAATLYDTVSNRVQTLRAKIQNFPVGDNRDTQKLQRLELERLSDELERLDRQLSALGASAENVGSLERLTRSSEHLQRRLEQVHTLGLPRRGDQS